MAKVMTILFAALLLAGCVSSVSVPATGHTGKMKITGYGRGQNRSQATMGAWNNAREKLNISGLQGWGLVEDQTIEIKRLGNALYRATIRFRVIPAQTTELTSPPAEGVPPDS